ncbi:MAG: hypothetical protein GY765_36120 [bacterium]|nr:hypothetical protein [bacterium]
MSDKNNSVHEAGESRHILKRISSKLLIAVLVAVILPFFGLVYYIDTQIETRLKENIVGQSLSGLAGSLAGEIDAIISRRNSELIFMSSDILGDKAVEEFRVERSTMKFREPHQRKPSWGPDVLMEWTRTPQPEGRWKGESFWRRTQTEVFNRYILQRHAYDLILLIDPEGRLVTCSSVNEDNSLPEQATVSGLFDRDYSGESWFRDALAGKIVRVDKHQSALLPLAGREDIDPARRYHIGFSAPVKCFDNDRDYSGVLYTLVNWRHIQARIDVPEIKAYFSGLVKDKEPSPYAWIWGSDANTILAHKDRKLYGLKINGSRINLPQMVVDALSAHSGHYREYTFRSIKKNAAFHHCNGPNDGPWTVVLIGLWGWVSITMIFMPCPVS